jgi:type I restriction enzyme S subunit
MGKKLDEVNPKYVAEYLGSAAATSWLVDSAVGVTMPNINTGILAALPMALPSRVEQDAIVDVLEGARSQANALEKIIVKKRAVRQGLTQQLLTGRIRLSGFTDEWVTLRVASQSVMKARIGWQGLTTAEYRPSGTHRLVGGTEFVDGRVDWNATPFVDKARYDQDPGIQLRTGDVLLTKDGSIGKTAYVAELPGPATLNSGVFVIRPLQGAYDSRFLYFMLKSRAFADFLMRLSAGSTISHLYQRDLVQLVLDVPATIDEQRAIADLLGTIDSEVADLDARLVKAHLVKAGMMQELLTGRTRLSGRRVAV